MGEEMKNCNNYQNSDAHLQEPPYEYNILDFEEFLYRKLHPNDEQKEDNSNLGQYIYNVNIRY